MDSTVPTILRPWVRIPSKPSMFLYSQIFYYTYLSLCWEKNENKQNVCLNLALDLVTTCYGCKAEFLWPACSWLGWGSMSIGLPSKSHCEFIKKCWPTLKKQSTLFNWPLFGQPVIFPPYYLPLRWGTSLRGEADMKSIAIQWTFPSAAFNVTLLWSILSTGESSNSSFGQKQQSSWRWWW